MSDNNVAFTQEESTEILAKLKILTFNIADCIGLLKYYQEPDSKREIIKGTLENDLECLMKLEDFIKEKLK